MKGRLRQRTLRTANSGLYADLASYQQHPLVQRSLPADIVAPVLDLWDDRESFLTALDQIPQTLQHGDARRKNLILRAGRMRIKPRRLPLIGVGQASAQSGPNWREWLPQRRSRS